MKLLIILQIINVFLLMNKKQKIQQIVIRDIVAMEPEKTQPRQIDRFSIFLNCKNAQNNYGVKTGDYMRYRRYCTSKINKIRKVMDYKYGNRTKFAKKDITVDRAEDKKILQVALLTCQRYWAYANQSKFNESIKQKKSNKLRAKFTAVKKLKRAHQWSLKLLKLCHGRTDNVTINEAQAYSFYLQGLMHLQRQDWKESQTKLIACREIISDLLGNMDTMNAKVYRQKIDQIDQTIKFCNFKISKGQEIPIEQIIEMRKNGEESLSNLLESLSQRRLKQMSLDSVNEIKFGNERYPVKDVKIIEAKSNVDLMIQNLEIIKKKVLEEMRDQQLFEQLLNFFSSTITTIDTSIKLVDSHKQNVKQYTQGQVAILKKISILFEQIKLKVLVDRNDIIFKYSYFNADKDNKRGAPQNLAKLLSNTISIYTQYIELEKAKNQGNEGLDPEKIRAVDAKVFYYRTLRLYFVGQVYFNNDKIKQAYSLWQECERCLQSVKNSQQEAIKSELSLVPLGEITSTLKQNKLKCIIKNFKSTQIQKQKLTSEMQQMSLQQNQGGKEEQNEEKSLYQLMLCQKNAKRLSLSEYSELKAIELPGQMQPVPTRPIFFDIFQSMIQYPTLENKVQRGWFGKLFNR